MAHTFLSLDMNLIPQTTKENVPTFHKGLFSNDNSRMLIDGRNDKGELVHPMSVLLSWTQWSESPREVVQSLLDDAIEYTSEEFSIIKNNNDSLWYAKVEVLT